MSVATISQGDQYAIPVQILLNDQPAGPGDFEDVEISIGSTSKRYSDSGLHYSESEKAYMFPVTQQETFKLCAAPMKAEVRVKFENGDVIRAGLDTVEVAASISKAVL